MHRPTPTSVLRDWTPDDAVSLCRHADNPRIARCMRDAFPHPYTPGDAERFIAMATQNCSALLLAIEVDGEAVGGIGVHPLADVYRGTAEIGYWLSEEHWDRGIATDAVRAMIPLAFDLFPIVRLQAGVFESKPASMRVLEKCGFCLEAVHRSAITKDGVVMDEHLSALLK
ncbi:GNAT family N-acetyltransferase [Methanofollis tationis]|uniref:GNAT family N-acetyltransferase n=1 Tax=Methanofollis tationis TaxID=81417 RepID=A0A7K4HMU3_9EURY|nr:GNAT family N-acetyltransferase [Methanofollis tationis]NVO66250.1 GNAT family N-acetyltransferase [Methanofollis tationis]